MNTQRRSMFLIIGIMMLFSIGIAASNRAVAQSNPSNLPISFIIPTGFVKVSDCVPGEGEHWAKPAQLPLGPILVMRNGRLLAIEYMIAQSDFSAGKSFQNLPFLYFLRELPIQHADIEFLPQGHPGFDVPHFDLHFWLVTHAQHSSILCP